MAHLVNLDALRALATVLVVTSHLPINDPEVNFAIRRIGFYGVGIFYVLTCQVLLMSLNKEDIGKSIAHLAIGFYVRRVFRIYPLSIITVLICYYFSGHLIGFVPSDFDLINSLLLTQNITNTRSIPGTLWSLSFELQMYAVLPIIYLIIKTRQRRIYLSVLIILSCAIPLLLWKYNLRYGIVSFIPCFLGGVISFVLSFKMNSKLLKLEFTPYLTTIAIFSILYSLAANQFIKLSIPETFLLWVPCILIGCTLPFVNQAPKNVFYRVMMMISKYSYGIYLSHAPIAYLFFHHFELSATLFTFISYLLSVAVTSFIAFHAIERPLINCGIWTARRLTK